MVGIARSACLTLAIASGIHGLPSEQEVLHLEGTSASPQEVRKKLKDADIISTVIDDFTPTFTLDVEWSSHNYAALGNTLKPKKLQEAPEVTLTPAKASACMSDLTYTIALTDPDAPSRDDPKWSEMCHWIATGLSAAPSSSGGGTTCTLSVRASDLDEVMPYKPPGPPEKTGKHRYVFIAFAPANGTTEPLNLTKPSDRQHWGTGKARHGVRDWAADNGLEPVGANFVYAQHKKQ